MSSLNIEQKQLLFDYCIGVATQEQTEQAEKLIESDPQAAKLSTAIHASLSPLNSYPVEDCPDSLVESTVSRLTNAARASQMELEQLIDEERKQSSKATTKRSFWRNFSELVAAAAVILFAAGVLIPSLRFARQQSWQQQCQMQLSRIFTGMNQYRADNDGSFPAVTQSAGQPWWKVGYQGEENYSNTRHIWLLVKDGYVDATNFVCPGRSDGQALQFDPAKAHKYNDFPARRYVTYSFRIPCPSMKGFNPEPGEGKVLLADMNPIFEELPGDYSQELHRKLTEVLASLNSSSHNREGQNVLSADGSVSFAEQRKMGKNGDDIYTLQNVQVYHGKEFPTCEKDAFLAP